jgi:hypothetical protein
MEQPEKKRSVWVYIGCGCGSLVLLSVLAMVVIGWVAANKMKEFSADMKDPAARATRAKKVLNVQTLPAGYYASVSLSVPLVMDMTMLTDRAPDASGEAKGVDKRGFLYFKIMAQDKDRQKARDYFAGKSDDAGQLGNATSKIKAKEVIRRGAIDEGGRKLLFVTQRGDTEFGDGKAEGLQTMMLFECSTDSKARMGIWFGEDPNPKAPAADLDVKGTVADEAEVKAFVAQIDPCGG